MPNIGPAEVAIVVIVALLILGPKKLPAAGRSLGGGLREFKNGITGHREAADAEADPAAVTAGAPIEPDKPRV